MVVKDVVPGTSVVCSGSSIRRRPCSPSSPLHSPQKNYPLLTVTQLFIASFATPLFFVSVSIKPVADCCRSVAAIFYFTSAVINIFRTFFMENIEKFFPYQPVLTHHYFSVAILPLTVDSTLRHAFIRLSLTRRYKSKLISTKLSISEVRFSFNCRPS